MRKSSDIRHDTYAHFWQSPAGLLGLIVVVVTAIILYFMGALLLITGSALLLIGAMMLLQFIPPKGWFGLLGGVSLAIMGIIMLVFR
jgi:hypothetical protein